MISLSFSFEIINVVISDPNIFLWITASIATVAAAVNPNCIKKLLANGLSIFFIKGNPVISNGPNILPKNPPDCPILCNWISDNSVLADKVFAKPLWCLATCALVNIESFYTDIILTLNKFTSQYFHNSLWKV